MAWRPTKSCGSEKCKKPRLSGGFRGDCRQRGARRDQRLGVGLSGRLSGRLFGWLYGWLTEWLSGWLYGWLSAVRPDRGGEAAYGYLRSRNLKPEAGALGCIGGCRGVTAIRADKMDTHGFGKSGDGCRFAPAICTRLSSVRGGGCRSAPDYPPAGITTSP